MSDILPDVRTFIESLGGATTVAAEHNKILLPGEKTLDREAVYKWKITNDIPHYRRPAMARLGVEKKVALPEILTPFAGGAPTPQPQALSNASNASNDCSLKSAASEAAA